MKKKTCKIHAGLQIEKIREREKEDSPLTKNLAPPWQLKRNKNYPTSPRERELITLLLYLLGFVANRFHIATSNALDALRIKGRRPKGAGHVISNTNKQAHQ